MDMLKIGTSGFSFIDWIGVFYPPDSRKENMFSTYVQYFDTVEINSTYYRIPPDRVFASLEEKTSDTFDFFVKLHKEATHEREKTPESVGALHKAVEPLKEKGKLKGFLAQFPYSFKNTADNRKYIKLLKENCSDVPLFVEFRHFSWLHPAIYEFLDSLHIHYCCVDEPPLRGLLPPQSLVIGDIGYVRFHGRNSETWWNSSKGDRYDYLYSERELSEWIERIREINKKASKAYLFFNNCHAGHAVRNAKLMAEILKKQCNIIAVLKDIPLQ